MSRCHACGLRNLECHTYVCMCAKGADRARGSGIALMDLEGLEENGAGPSGRGGGERGIFNHRGRGQARWAFRAWGSGGEGIYHSHTPRRAGSWS